jgi:hypothetical protein
LYFGLNADVRSLIEVAFGPADRLRLTQVERVDDDIFNSREVR